MGFEHTDDIASAMERGELSVRALYQIWDLRQPVPEASARAASSDSGRIPWVQSDLGLCLQFLHRAFAAQEYLLVCDAAREMLRYWQDRDGNSNPDLLRVRMRLASGLTRLGEIQRASRELERCLDPNFRPRAARSLRSEILLQLGDVCREEWSQATTKAAAIQATEAALEHYQQALTLKPDWLEANIWVAAATLHVAGQHASRRRQALACAENLLTRIDDDAAEFQALRARAESLTLLGRDKEARTAYAALCRADDRSFAKLADARYRTRFLADAVGRPRDFLYDAFPPLQLVVFTGHMPDRPGTPGRFPPEQIEPVRGKLREKLEEMHAHIGICSAAAGADLLFVDELSGRPDNRFHVVLPWSEAEFRQTSVLPYEPGAGEPIWDPLFKKATQNAASLRQLGEFYQPSQESNVGWKYMLEVQSGLALHTARMLQLDVRPLALWDGRAGRGPGGTADFVQLWREQLGVEPEIVEMPQAAAASAMAKFKAASDRAERSVLHQEVKSMLFADIVGYSKFKEQAIPAFVTGFLRRVSQLAAESPHAPQSVSTWGDAIYAVFDFAVDAGSFALELTQLIHDNREEWLENGLYSTEPAIGDVPPAKRPLNIRIGLHTGPVFQHYNPLMRQLGFTGAHVSRAARIEPVTQPGEVYASEEFAALVELEAARKRHRGEPDATGFACEYAGTMPLAKGYPGRYRIYRLMPTRRLDHEELAKAIHEAYCEQERKAGHTAEDNPMLRRWDELAENMREANREQAADIPHKLRMLGYELTPRGGIAAAEIVLQPDRVEEVSKYEHVRWMNERQRNGWTYAPTRDNALKRHPLIVDWEQLPESEKQKDRDTILNLPALVARAGFRVRKIG